MDLLFISFVILSLAFLFIIIGQYKKIQFLEKQNRKLKMNGNKDEWIAKAREKLETVGNIKTVKYVREETGMSLLEAKQFVDSLEGNR
ncbi:hypothetical protein [Lederbergia lenta]|uniref:Ribosomal protein L7/L12 C-terminal domain-containing protein n=1 Tax=Lederbergia lenta TaxID=1467 RepID=A0A2X4WAR5_LEDLE|nr:hypothetical protein [Lederbergia lenta]MCM3109783.1 hypothetical protein [Lederbergia lenta]MEC2324467.1 hypothetical protein [Lederbergia lenta]SQI59809.1 Uncharacterised protein [Lederbergia lenta]